MRDLRDALRATLPDLSPEVVAVWLYGSQARGTAHGESDVDLAVLLAVDPPPTVEGLGIALADELVERIGRRIDLVIVNRAPADLVHRVLRDGELLLDRDPARRIRFEVRSRNEYFDLQPYLDTYRRGARAPGAAPAPAPDRTP